MNHAARGQARGDKIMLRSSPRFCQLPDGRTQHEETSMSCSVISALATPNFCDLSATVSWFFALKDTDGRPERLQSGLLPSSRLVSSRPIPAVLVAAGCLAELRRTFWFHPAVCFLLFQPIRLRHWIKKRWIDATDASFHSTAA